MNIDELDLSEGGIVHEDDQGIGGPRKSDFEIAMVRRVGALEDRYSKLGKAVKAWYANKTLMPYKAL